MGKLSKLLSSSLKLMKKPFGGIHKMQEVVSDVVDKSDKKLTELNQAIEDGVIDQKVDDLAEKVGKGSENLIKKILK